MIRSIDKKDSDDHGHLKELEHRKMNLAEQEKIELMSDDVQEILGKVPPWIIRWGVTVILSVIIMVFVGSTIFKYPDVIATSIVIISENPPVSLIAHSTGKIDYLFVQNSAEVKNGEVLAILENTANYTEVLELKNKMPNLRKVISDSSNVSFPELRPYNNLGPVQSAYSNYQRQMGEYMNYKSIRLIDKKILSIKQQRKDYDTYIIRLMNQSKIQYETVALTHKQFVRDSVLFIGGTISASDFEKSQQSFLQVRNSYQSLLAVTANTQMQVNQLDYQIIDLQSQNSDQTQHLLNIMKESYDNLNTSISDWEKTYVLKTPMDGKITFNKFWNINQYVTNGEVVFTVIPSTPQQIIGRIKLPVSGSGKVKSEQKVLIFLDNYPYTEYGMLEGKIKTISLIPETTSQGVFYTAEVALPNGLSTNYKNLLPFNQEMQGSAEIITKELTLFERLINPIKSSIKKSL